MRLNRRPRSRKLRRAALHTTVPASCWPPVEDKGYVAGLDGGGRGISREVSGERSGVADLPSPRPTRWDQLCWNRTTPSGNRVIRGSVSRQILHVFRRSVGGCDQSLSTSLLAGAAWCGGSARRSHHESGVPALHRHASRLKGAP